MRPDLKGLEVQGVVYPNHFHLMGGSILGIYHGNIWGTMGTETNKMRCFGCFLSHGKTPIKSSKLSLFFFLNRDFGGFGVKKTQYYRKGKSLSAAG